MIPAHITVAAKYEPAMRIATQAEADAYFEECVEHTRQHGQVSRERAEEIERSNLGYWAGYHDQATRLRVEELFRCEHPVLGKARDREWTAYELFQKGVEMGQKWKQEEEEKKRK